jgi:hypothetical protein
MNRDHIVTPALTRAGILKNLGNPFQGDGNAVLLALHIRLLTNNAFFG